MKNRDLDKMLIDLRSMVEDEMIEFDPSGECLGGRGRRKKRNIMRDNDRRRNPEKESRRKRRQRKEAEWEQE